MNNEIPIAVIELQQNLANAKDLMNRMKQGEKFISNAYRNREITSSVQGIELYNKLMKQVYDELEHALFMHEYLSTGRTVVLNRNGRGVNITPDVDGEPVMMDPWTLHSFGEIKNVFGGDMMNFIEIRDVKKTP